MKRALFTVLVFALACGGSTEPRVASVSGAWSGTIAGTQGQVLTMTLLDVSGQVLGSGSLNPTPSGSLGLAVSGSFVAPNFTATLESGTYPTMLFAGVLASNGTTMNGTIDGAGFNGQAVVLAKQP